MGLFSTKKKTVANTSVSRAVDDASIIPSNKMAILSYVMSSDSMSTKTDALSISDYIISATSNNSVARAKRARSYASKEDYYYGLPKSNLVSQEGVDIQAAIQDALEIIYPEGVIVNDAYFGPMNNFYFLKPMLTQKYGYNQDTNELVDESARIGFPCYMESAVIKYSQYSTDALVDPDTIKQVGLSAEAGYTPFREWNYSAKQVPWIENSPLDHDTVDVTVVYKNAANEKVSYVITMDYLEYEASSKPSDIGLDETAAGVYEPNAVTPTLDAQLQDQDFFQANYEYTENSVTKRDTFIYLRGAGYIPALDNLFSVTDEFGSYIPRVYARMGGKKCNADEFKDTDKYKAMKGLGNKLGMNWSNWVDELHEAVGSVGSVSQMFLTYSLPANTKDPLIQSYLFEYFMELYGRIPNRFSSSVFSSLRKDMIAYGSKLGQMIRISDKAYEQQLKFSSIGYVDIQGSIGAVGSTTSGTARERIKNTGKFSFSSFATYHYYRKQLTANTYREIRVYGLSITEYVQGGVVTSASGNSENLLIPLDMAINHEFSNAEKEELYTKSMYIVINTVQVIKTKWYQTGVFKAIMIVVAVVIAVVTVGAGAPISAYIIAAAVAVAKAVVLSVVIQMAAKILVSVGVDVGLVAAIAAIAAIATGAYAALKDAAVAGMTATQLLALSSQAFSMSTTGFALQTKETLKAFNSVMADLTKQQKEMQEKYKDLGLAQDSTLLMFEPPISLGVRMGESADDYYSRSIHISNIGSSVYYFIENNVANSVTLPSLSTILKNIEESVNGLHPAIQL